MSKQLLSRRRETGHKTEGITRRSVALLLMLLHLLFFSVEAYSDENRPFDTKGPIVVTSSTLTSDNKAHTSLFEGSVIARSDTMIIYSDAMLVYSSEGGNITRIDCTGHVKLIKGERVITSNAATYLADEDKAIFTGEPRAIGGGNIVTGTKITYFMKDDRSVVEDSKVFIENKNRKEK